MFYRVQKALDHNLYFLSKLKDKNKIEIIYVDWGSKKAISDFIFVNKEFTNQVKFIHVNEKIAKGGPWVNNDFIDCRDMWSVDEFGYSIEVE